MGVDSKLHTKIAFELIQQVDARSSFFRSLTIARSICHTAKNSLRVSQILAVLRNIRAIEASEKRADQHQNLLEQFKRKSRHPESVV